MARVLLRERLLAGEALAAWLAPLKADRKGGSGNEAGAASPETAAELLAG